MDPAPPPPDAFVSSETSLGDLQQIADHIVDDGTDDEMPRLQDVSDTSDEDDDEDEDEYYTDEDDDEDAVPDLLPMPPSSSTSSSTDQPAANSRRARVEDAEEEDRDRQAPSQRNSGTSSAGLRSARPSRHMSFRATRAAERDFQRVIAAQQRGAPTGGGDGARVFNYMGEYRVGATDPTLPHPVTATNNTAGSLPQPPPMERSYAAFRNPRRQSIMIRDEDMDSAEAHALLHANFPVPWPPGQAPAMPSGGPRAASATAGSNPNDPAAALANFLLEGGMNSSRIRPGQRGGAFNFMGFGVIGPEQEVREQQDPERARRLVDGLEAVSVGLLRRMIRTESRGVNGEEGGDGQGYGGCAICWDQLLSGDDDAGVEAETNADAKGKGKAEAQADAKGKGKAKAEDEEEDVDEDKKKDDETTKRPKIVSLPCAHVFHVECLIPWFSRPRHTTCPTCRFDIDPYGLTYVSARERARAAAAAAMYDDLPALEPVEGPATAAQPVQPQPQSAATHALAHAHTHVPDAIRSVLDFYDQNAPSVRFGPPISSQLRPQLAQAAAFMANPPAATAAEADMQLDDDEGPPPLIPATDDVTMSDLPDLGNPFYLPNGAEVTILPSIPLFAAQQTPTPDAAPAATAIPPTGPTLTDPALSRMLNTEDILRLIERDEAEERAIALETDDILRLIEQDAEDEEVGEWEMEEEGMFDTDDEEEETHRFNEFMNVMMQVPPQTPAEPQAQAPVPPRPPAPAATAQGQNPEVDHRPLRRVYGRRTPPGPFIIDDDSPMTSFVGGFSRRRSPIPEGPRVLRPWAPPPAPGLTLRQRVERREREIGLRCSDVSCGIGPSDEDAAGEVISGLKQLAIRHKEDWHGYGNDPLCEHRFHSACLVTAERVARRGATAIVEENGRVQVSCSVCRSVGYILKEEWEEGVLA